MKLSDTLSSAKQAAMANVAKASQNTSAQTAATAQAPQRAQASGVAVTVSTLARGLDKASRSSAADIDTQKVATVKAAIQDGSYVINPEAIADKLLSNSKELLDRTTS
jgi:negative regulator of flagellin synthesis FlgM